MERCGRIDGMTCDETEILLHALIDGELDAGHARDVEAHVATCPGCTEKLGAFRAMHGAMATADLREKAPAQLRSRIEAALNLPPARAAAAPQPSWLERLRASWQTFFGGFAMGSVLSAAVAASLVLAVMRNDQNQLILSDVVSAHLRSLQASRLIDVQSGDQHTVRPWLGNRLGAAPPVPDLSQGGFSLVGGRIDYVLGKPVAAIVYRHSGHLINLFVAQGADTERDARLATMQGVNVDLWSEKGLNLCAVGDVSGEELEDFRKKFDAAAWAAQI
jgi:anti-sigma factor (TIGR02949 family)